MTTKNSKSTAFPTEPTPIKQLATVLTRLSLSDLDSLVKGRKIKAPKHSARDLIDPDAVLATYAAARSEVEFDDDDDDEAEGEFLSDFADFIDDPLIAAMLQASPEGVAELFLDVYDDDDDDDEEEGEEDDDDNDDDNDDWEN